jgi:hypothetical protein
MALELMSDDFNRGDQELNGSIATGPNGGWQWQKVTSGSSFLRVDDGAGIGGTPGVLPGSGTGNRIYRPNEQIAGTIGGVQIDVREGLNSSGAILALRLHNAANYLWGAIRKSDGNVTLRQVGGGAPTPVTFAEDTIAYPSGDFTFSMIMIGGGLTLYVGSTPVLVGGVADPEILLLDNFAGIGHFPGYFSNGSIACDNFNAGLPFLLGFGSAESEANESDPAVQRRLLDEQRRASLLGGRQNTILTSSLGLTDAVPIAKIHPIGRC